MSKRDKILDEYERMLLLDSAKARDLIKKLDYKNDPLLLVHIGQTFLDESRFFPDGTMRELIDWRKWRAAERYFINAFKINSSCLMVLSAMGSLE